LEVPDDLVRLSVGIEDVADLLGDLEQALRQG
jgi:cystathionine gamma-synthase